MREVLDDECVRNAAQIEPLTTRENGRQDFLRLRRSEHELHMGRGLFQRLQERIEGRRREHVNFVDDVELEFGTGGGVFAGFAQVAHLFDAVIAGAVNFENVQRAPFRNFDAARVGVVKLDLRSASRI